MCPYCQCRRCLLSGWIYYLCLYVQYVHIPDNFSPKTNYRRSRISDCECLYDRKYSLIFICSFYPSVCPKGIVAIMSSVRPSVCLFVRPQLCRNTLRFWSISRKPLNGFQPYYTHMIPKCPRCAFWDVRLSEGQNKANIRSKEGRRRL
jgi:hypothetical protein